MHSRKKEMSHVADSLVDIMGQVALVYWNSHRRCYSVRISGIVRAHVRSLMVDKPELIIWEAGRQRARREGKKNVHAFVRGKVYPALDVDCLVGRQTAVTYSPYEHPGWMSHDNTLGVMHVSRANAVSMTTNVGKPVITAWGAI